MYALTLFSMSVVAAATPKDTPVPSGAANGRPDADAARVGRDRGCVGRHQHDVAAVQGRDHAAAVDVGINIIGDGVARACPGCSDADAVPAAPADTHRAADRGASISAVSVAVNVTLWPVAWTLEA